jgi:hypothetical protein
MSKLFFVFFIIMILIMKLHNYFLKGKAELKAVPEAEALPEALTFC